VGGVNPVSHHFSGVNTYPVRLTIVTDFGCSGDTTIPIQVVASPKIGIGGFNPACEPATLTFTGIEVTPDPYGPLSWSWNFDNGQTANVQNPGPISYPKAGSYAVKLTATNTKGCATTYPAVADSLKIYPLPNVNAGRDTTICWSNPATPFPLHATGDPAVSFTWQPPADGTVSCTACADAMATAAETTYFVVTGQSPPIGCQRNDTIKVKVNTPVTVAVGPPDSVCLGQSAQLTASGADIYSWTPGAGLSNPDIANPVATPTADQLGGALHNVITYSVTGYDDIKCFSDTKSINVTAFQYPTIDLGPDITLPVGSSYQINGNGSPDIVSMTWSPTTSLSCINCLDPIANPIKTIDYKLTVVNDGGCFSSDGIHINVVCTNGNFFIPNTFSPNGDGVNDRFIVRGKGLNIIPSITIYNRWGQIVFEKRNFAPNDESQGWDGTFNGKPAPSDVYIYTVQILCDNATLIPYHGNVTLVR
ncbi:MAG TPA: gliding motility-associated C-terminal domain-containing protein, partial [Puia sp.]|nr:gliding motility-associated C-terminal domain-containing protein [Puia sp.]